MTKSTITRERLAKIKSWREAYGAGSNVMLPAEEAEELACLALAAAKTITLPTPACTYADHSYPAYTKQQVLTMLESLGVTVVEEDV